MSRRSLVGLLGSVCLVVACNQLGNPPQFATGPTEWSDANGRLVTTTRSFRDEKTIRRLASEGLGDLDHSDAAISPSQTLTIVSVVPRKLRMTGRPTLTLVTTFKLENQALVSRRWVVPASGRRWTGAFALPEPPLGAATSVEP